MYRLQRSRPQREATSRAIRNFSNSDAERDFFYRLDYEDFTFDPATFAHSNDERQLDRLLYKLSYVVNRHQHL